MGGVDIIIFPSNITMPSPEKLGPFYTLQRAWHLLRLTTILGKINKQEWRLIIKNGGL